MLKVDPVLFALILLAIKLTGIADFSWWIVVSPFFFIGCLVLGIVVWESRTPLLLILSRPSPNTPETLTKQDNTVTPPDSKPPQN